MSAPAHPARGLTLLGHRWMVCLTLSLEAPVRRPRPRTKELPMPARLRHIALSVPAAPLRKPMNSRRFS